MSAAHHWQGISMLQMLVRQCFSFTKTATEHQEQTQTQMYLTGEEEKSRMRLEHVSVSGNWYLSISLCIWTYEYNEERVVRKTSCLIKFALCISFGHFKTFWTCVCSKYALAFCIIQLDPNLMCIEHLWEMKSSIWCIILCCQHEDGKPKWPLKIIMLPVISADLSFSESPKKKQEKVDSG